MNDLKLRKKAFTLIEMIISLTVFTMIVVIGSNIYVSTQKSQKRANLEAAIFNEALALVEKLSREIRISTIDYEEYYNQKVIAVASRYQGNSQYKKYYGTNFGEYAKNFYAPGLEYSSVNFQNRPPLDGKNSGVEDRSGLGAQCVTTGATTELINPPTPCPAEAKVLKKTLDNNAGQNFWHDGSKASAFCDETHGISCADKQKLYEGNQELYLLNAEGNQKTIFALEKNGDQNSLAMIRLKGEDTTGDGISDKWKCMEPFDCGQNDPEKDTNFQNGENYYKNDLAGGIDDQYFVPITPSSIFIKDIKFIISPLEDPRLAFNEFSSDIQIQPHVIVEIVLQPSKVVLKDYLGDPPSITVRTTVSSRINNVIKSYNPL